MCSFFFFTLEPCIRVRVWAVMPPREIANRSAQRKLLIVFECFFRTQVF